MSDWGPTHPCHDCGVLIQYYTGPRGHGPISLEVGTQLRHAPRCAGTARWVAATLAEINRPAWEQPGYYVAAPEPQRPQQPAQQTQHVAHPKTSTATMSRKWVISADE